MDLEKLENALSESLTWRKQELQQARDLAEIATDNSRQHLCRAWTLMMYAHCDQYVKEVSRLYLSFLKDNPRSTYDYWSIWQAFRAKELMLNGSDDPVFSSALEPRNNDKLDLIDTISHKTVLESGSFKYERLRFLTHFVLQIKFDCVSYKAFCGTLKVKRDQIAHGEQAYISGVEDCIAWHSLTFTLLDDLTSSVLGAAALP